MYYAFFFLIFLVVAVVASAAGILLWKMVQQDRVPFIRDEAKLAYKVRLEVDFRYLISLDNPQLQVLAAKIDPVLKTHSRVVRWPDLYVTEKLIYRAAADDFLAKKWSELIYNYREIASAEEIARAEEAGLLVPDADSAVIRANTPELIDRIQRWRRVSVRRVNMKNGVSFVVASLFFVIVMAGCAIGFLYHGLAKVPVFAVIVFSGVMGGFASAQARIQAIPEVGARMNDLNILRIATGVILATVTGAIGSIFLYVMFGAGILEGELFPHVNHNADKPFGDFGKFLTCSNPETNGDMAKVVLWSFAAGFSERLVPDQVFFLTAQLPKSGNKTAA